MTILLSLKEIANILNITEFQLIQLITEGMPIVRINHTIQFNKTEALSWYTHYINN